MWSILWGQCGVTALKFPDRRPDPRGPWKLFLPGTGRPGLESQTQPLLPSLPLVPPSPTIPNPKPTVRPYFFYLSLNVPDSRMSF